MVSAFITVRVDFNTDDKKQAKEWADNLRLLDENDEMNAHIYDLEVCGINEIASAAVKKEPINEFKTLKEVAEALKSGKNVYWHHRDYVCFLLNETPAARYIHNQFSCKLSEQEAEHCFTE